MLHDIVSKDSISCTDADIELLEESDMSDSTQTGIEFDSIDNNAFFINFNDFYNTHNIFLYLQNTYEIYLGLIIPPPKYL